ncbi:MAG: glycosyltransferase family 4 protein [Deltaproteobacteria bacterium]|nr:glycosyltransferase family 4 protein [Deltaproteobacteria bacterium]
MPGDLERRSRLDHESADGSACELRRRVLIVQPYLNPRGGSSAVAAWIVEALRDPHHVTLLTWQRPDFAAVDRSFDTRLATGGFTCVLGPPRLHGWLERVPLKLDLLKDSCLVQHARRLAPSFDVVISANNEHDLGRPAIQYVHYPRFEALRPARERSAWYQGALAVRGYRRAVSALTRTRPARLRANRTLTNSDWVGERYRDVHGGTPETLNPPAPGTFPERAWSARADGIVCIGRLAAEKRLEVVVDAVERVRARGFDLRLRLIGTPDRSGYATTVRRLVAARPAWATLHEGLSRAALCALVAGQRYGIHAMPDEHFGIAVAEMLRGGCIPFVPASGGPAEIVGRDPRLLFRDAGEAADRIAAVMADDTLQASLRSALAARRERFTPEHFVHRLRAIVAQFDPDHP